MLKVDQNDIAFFFILSEGYRVREIWETRDNVLGLWSVLGCTMAGVIELLLGETIPFPRYNSGIF